MERPQQKQICTKKESAKGLVILAAGGTGGHIHSALALGKKFEEEGYEILYISGRRPLDYQLYKGRNVLHLNSFPLKHKNPLKILLSLWNNFCSLAEMLTLLKEKKPKFMIGAGGYVCGPSLFAGYLLKIPIFILEQNSVMGLTNKILGYFSDKIFVHFQKTQGLSQIVREKVVVSGNPTRKDFFLEENLKASSPREKKTLNLLVFGGSLGAKSINSLIEAFIQNSPPFSLSIKHQTGKEDKVSGAIKIHENIHYEQREFFEEIKKEYQWSDVIISRAGGSTVSELRLVKKPVILIPYPLHKDKHQFFNAFCLQEEVAFPVHVKTVDELKGNSFEQLKKILQQEKERLDQKRAPVLNKENPLNATEIIFREIVNYV